MATNQISSSGLLDIVFEGRNKSYGAYELRAGYNARMLRAIGITFLVLLLLYLLASLRGNTEKTRQKQPSPPVATTVWVDKEKQQPILPPPPIPPPSVAAPDLRRTGWLIPG